MQTHYSKYDNLAHRWVHKTQRTVEGVKADYFGACIDFAGDFLDAIGRGRLAYFELPNHPIWKYHAAAEIDGVIHDLWTDTPLPTALYAKLLGATSVSYPDEEEPAAATSNEQRATSKQP